MIDKQYGRLSIICDNCGDGKEGFKTFDDVQEYIKDNDWKQTNRNGIWEHYCCDCWKCGGI